MITWLSSSGAGAGTNRSIGVLVVGGQTLCLLLTLLAVAMAGLLLRALLTGEWWGALFLVGFALLFTWQIGGFVKRNRPRGYDFDHLPEALLP